MSKRVILLFGSNLGDRRVNLETARLLLGRDRNLVCQKTSEVMETEALGFEGPAFLNLAASYLYDGEPLDLLQTCKAVEKEMGRSDAPEYDAAGKRIYHDRIIDIDILSFEGVTMDTERLRLPHPQLKTRPFVAALMSQL